ncbi:MAG: hypothetical protein IAB19_08025 [Proteobacteria bacterium]|uniref:Tetratricopeptide repeat protein n=1 Tax=Candidatus Avisuccinivibrio stercorigallinarum TaxID=2840704 RepID=A0A9D9DD22_9GAMM|nr:hypothetical protein [Candidatus Avisuccinivibrio stercorigallinarum]
MAESTLSKDELTALRVLAFFFYQCGNARAAEHAAKAVLAVQPEDVWAQQFLVLCADSAEDFDKVLELTDKPELLAAVPGDETEPSGQAEQAAARERSLILLRARALHKLGRSEESRTLLEQAQIIRTEQE